MKITTKAIYNLMVRFAIISVSALVIASCNKEDDTEPTPDVASIEITNFEDGDYITLGEATTFQTFVNSPSGYLQNAKLAFTNVDNGEVLEFTLEGKVPKSANIPVQAVLSADVKIDVLGAYKVIASYDYLEEGSASVIVSEEITIEAAAMIDTE
ncbi:hypothetical protein [Flammeovirga kamogawensis]|uniref:DUF4625 domain-containing protein n=1 Tax=Flammeovirga kamogawensis TaxID=373891 RepID=A0ABX8GUA0_9BACT|nr:hypothetical protein [Flammeovirga kamogawensis]MBB6459777.1 hypothetical protein [Flammeovirga kamogawensis]QWG07165.1 hypothetical protein KM029_17965 [Flammeovirga kamogawensis]TRX68987.1 hypothetical protein EO216_12955 [Flammeovirga kamogawensis]